jgi:nitrogen regulatory protein PII
MRMVMISYNSAINSEITEALSKSGVENYTKWRQVQGKGKSSGSHFGSEIWPGENSVLFCALEDDKAGDLLRHIKELRARLNKVGVKAFIWRLEDIS